jgi:phosphohistidine phosphatase
MKTLFLFRHAKALPGDNSLRDFDRSLSDEGRRQVERVGKQFKKRNLDLNQVLSSTALRARQTTELFLQAAESVTEVRYDQRIYEASRQQLVEVISEIDTARQNVLLVGHNPGFEELLHRLTGRLERMGTATLAKIDFAAQAWGQAAQLTAQLDWLVKPNDLSTD